MSAKNTVLQKIIYYSLCEHIFAYIMLIFIEGTVWSVHGNLVL